MKIAVLTVFAMLGLGGCQPDPVTWSEVVSNDVPPEPVEGLLRVSLPDWGGCVASRRIAQSRKTLYAVWWSVRPDSSAILMLSRSSGAGQWSTPVIADSTDRGTRGCGRFAPSISADSLSRYLHLAYFAEPESGGGVFFSHSMDDGATFHAPVAIVYGRNPVRASVASWGDRVVVAYEDPNSAEPLLGIALSRTTGHIFEKRLMVTTSSEHAGQPEVRVGGDSIRLWWSEYSPNPSINATRPRYRAGSWN